MTAAHTLTIVMYHYVRDIRGGRYAAIKGLEIEQFRGQLDYIVSHYNPVSVNELVDAIGGGPPLPERAILLQFDDGYRDHVENAAPELARRGIEGTFFPIAAAAIDRRVILANKAQFVLATEPDVDKLIVELERRVTAHAGTHDLLSLADYRAKYFHATRLDGAPVIYLKRMLQAGLPVALAETIASDLFRRYVTEDEASFADELYMSVDDLKRLLDDGHQIGCHTDRHPWMTGLGKTEQRQEVERALRLHDALGLSRRGFTFCYPYGGYDASAMEVLDELGCAAAFTAEVALARADAAMRLRLPRLDAIDLPMRAGAEPGSWTRQVLDTPKGVN